MTTKLNHIDAAIEALCQIEEQTAPISSPEARLNRIREIANKAIAELQREAAQFRAEEAIQNALTRAGQSIADAVDQFGYAARTAMERQSIVHRLHAAEGRADRAEAERDRLMAAIMGKEEKPTVHSPVNNAERLEWEIEREDLLLEIGKHRMCVNCGRIRDADKGIETPGDGCQSPDACSWNMTPQEAANYWRQKAHKETARADVAAQALLEISDAGSGRFWKLDDALARIAKIADEAINKMSKGAS